MSLVLVPDGFLIDPSEFFPLLLHSLLWDFANKQATLWGGVLIFLIFLGIIPLLDSLIRALKDQCFRLRCQTRRYLSSRPQRSLVEQILAMSCFYRISIHLLQVGGGLEWALGWG